MTADATRWPLALLVAIAGCLFLAARILVAAAEPAADDVTSAPPTGIELLGLGRPVGFGEATTGGDGGPIRWVDTLEDAGPGSLRAALREPGPAWIRFRPGLDGLITLSEPLDVPSDVTIDGRGARVTIDNHGLILAGERNVIVAYLRFDFAENWEPYDGNAAVMVTEGTTDVWLDHLTFVGAGPGNYHQALLFIDGAHRITASWNRFVMWDRTILVGQDNENPELAADEITLHHNWFDRTHQRNPLVRFARVHTFNNWLYRYGWPGHGAGMVIDAGAQLVSEADIFEDAFGRYAIKSGDWDSDARPGSIRHVANWLIDVEPELVDLGGPDRVFDPRDEYVYFPDPADTDLRRAIRAGAGWQPVAADRVPDPG